MPAEAALDIVEVVVRVAAALEAVGIEYVIGGSVASSLYGEPRSTNDVDVAIRVELEQIPRWIKALGPDFDVDEESLRDAVRHARSWNIFYLPSMLKIDLFARGRSAFDDSEFARKRAISLVPGGRAVHLSSLDDNLLWKLKWFRMGGEISDRQWRDVVGIIRVSGAELDRLYLARWASEWALVDLLEKALATEPAGQARRTGPAAQKRKRLRRRK